MRLTIRDIQKKKDTGERFTVLTAYDATSAQLSEAAGVTALLVGDTLGMVIQGQNSTLPVTMEHMIYHTSIVTRVTEKPLVVADLPFMTYNLNPEQALTNAARLMQEAGASCVKLEGGEHMAPTIARLVEAGIPVMAHLGFTPQGVNQFGGFRVQGRELEPARQLLRDAKAIQDAGAFSVVLELVPAPLSKLITERLRIPTIGIGAGIHCDGEVQVFHDILGLFAGFIPRHTRRFMDAGSAIREAIQAYNEAVVEGSFPDDSNSFTMSDEVITALLQEETD
jgi:3-methyl-2-oxobutanoate hydroxymethyltransferase